MKLFVGLGNPGEKYARNRHNIGFMALDRIAADHGFSPWRAKFQGLVSEGRLGREKVLLLKPQTYMNLSGQSVGAAMRFHKLDPADVTVFHDELDLAPGKCRVKRGGGHAGHNGLRSIHQHAGPDYARVRLGIGRPAQKAQVAAYVLHDFAKADEAWLDDLLRAVSDAAPRLAEDDDSGFMNAVALRMAPPPRPAAQTPPGGAADDGRKADEGRRGPDAGGDGAKDDAALSPLERLKRRFS
ncbi:aminoacyl-tRNA hydrolase [Oceanicella actignis]|uniref:aminoacyl-tRNA hydrolase n=1 Tax=Oceanicella actignis TaxID=1189325 RepID=UPI0011E6E1A5|nr:aminoacyl-tRNA hydrolase [Oceanicella actignis]TYO85401.1 peptidyl-tRNA hydrolase [Oceanicella actignis]